MCDVLFTRLVLAGCLLAVTACTNPARVDTKSGQTRTEQQQQQQMLLDSGSAAGGGGGY